MIQNYLKVAWRIVVRNKAFSGINILGLALGMACSLLIMLWVRDERNMDAFHAHGKQLFQVYEKNTFDGKTEGSYSTQALLADELKRNIPEIENASSLEWNTNNTFEAGDKINKMEGSFAGEDFFSMFSYPLLQGSARSALTTIQSIAISRKMAEHFFGSPEKAIGKTIRYENSEDLQVTAVFENTPANSSFKFDFLRSWSAFKKENSSWVDNWGNTDAPTFVQLQEQANSTAVAAKLKDFVYKFKERSKGFRVELALQPFTEKYLHATFKNGEIAGGRIEYVRLFSMVAIFILLIACINFMNLATARSVKRAREIGVRKVVGAGRLTLMSQFIGEAMLLTFLAFFVAVVFVLIVLPAFNNLTGKQLTLPVASFTFWTTLLGLLLMVGFIAGSYPALFLSSLKPIRVLKGSLKFKWGATFFRKSLVVFQFTLSIIMIVGMTVIYRQLNYVQTKNLGYDRENLLYLPMEGELGTKYSVFKQEALKLQGIKNISKIRQTPTSIGNHTGDIKWAGKDPNVVASFVNSAVGYDFVATMHLQLAEGRDFSRDFGTDSAAFLLNETAIKKIGYTDPIGKTIWWGNHEGKIIGVLKDFHVASMHQAIEPLIVRLDENRQWASILVRTEKGKTKEALSGLDKLYRTMNPKFPFTYQFSDLEFAKLYQSEQLVGKLSNYFAFLAIFISCLGLFGLATFAASQRTREISVRKILGASVSNILALLSGSFLKPVAMAILIASPIAWYVMNKWLDDFAYKIAIRWWMFAVAGVTVIVVALATISFQAIKAAIANPVKSLKTE